MVSCECASFPIEILYIPLRASAKKPSSSAAIHTAKTLVTLLHRRAELFRRVFAVFIVRDLYSQPVFL